MHFRVITSVFLISASASVVAGSLGPSMVGSYLGEVESGEGMSKMTTSLKQSENGVFSGSYVFVDETGEVQGEITACDAMESTHIKCIWKDVYGYGDLEFIFNGSFTKFYGAWSSFGSSDKSVWYGVKQ